MAEREGLILKGVGGFYTVWDNDVSVVCKPRGRLRLDHLRPLPGDRVRMHLLPDGSGIIDEILPRQNAFVRPPVANIETLVIVGARAVPETDPFLIDRMTALAESKGIGALICLNKVDLKPADELAEVYRAVGYPTVLLSAETGAGVDELAQFIAGKVVAFTGNSGVGKSSLLNRLRPELALRVGEVSHRGGRGRHTTRHTELLPMLGGAWAADTPGFSTFDDESLEQIRPQALRDLFPEFRPFEGACRFTGCHHIGVAGCAVLEALARGAIPASRHASYVRLYRAASERRPF
ncbi:MAG: ribosome small subunit-dependent GTPase A [Oscillospiraceae bacterium]|jgi:ribosome biogenesis GTPase|nr:ribosome small subunit-dependent GTPase A [Oscillospiraceae bacterium]